MLLADQVQKPIRHGGAPHRLVAAHASSCRCTPPLCIPHGVLLLLNYRNPELPAAGRALNTPWWQHAPSGASASAVAAPSAAHWGASHPGALRDATAPTMVQQQAYRSTLEGAAHGAQQMRLTVPTRRHLLSSAAAAAWRQSCTVPQVHHGSTTCNAALGNLPLRPMAVPRCCPCRMTEAMHASAAAAAPCALRAPRLACPAADARLLGLAAARRSGGWSAGGPLRLAAASCPLGCACRCPGGKGRLGPCRHLRPARHGCLLGSSACWGAAC